VDGLVAVRADHEGLAAPLSHQLRPRRLWSSRLVEVGQLADLVDFHRAVSPAPLAPSRREPGEQLFTGDGDRAWSAVGEDRCLLALNSRNLIEDPLFHDSRRSQLIQMADLVAWTTYAHLNKHAGNQYAHTWYDDYLKTSDANGAPIAI
jgi:hypothetical protein